jgi:hypothetical protein
MLQGHPLGTPLHQTAQRLPIRVAEWSVEFQIQIHPPFFPQRVRQQMLGIQSRTLDTALTEIGRRGIQDFKNGHHGSRRNYAIASSGDTIFER